MRKKWTGKEIQLLIKLFKEGKSIEDASKVVGRSPRSVVSKFDKRRLNISIKDLQRESYYEEVECKVCGAEFEALKSENRKFCGHTCSATYTNKERGDRSEDTKNKISESIKKKIEIDGKFGCLTDKHRLNKEKIGWQKLCPICKNNFYVTESIKTKIFCSVDCLNHEDASEYHNKGGYRKNSTRKLRSIYKGFQMDSGSEKTFAMLLDENNITWVKNTDKFFEYTGVKGKSRKYYPDFYLPDYDFWVEIKSKFYQTENLELKLEAVGDNIELMYFDEIRLPRCL